MPSEGWHLVRPELLDAYCEITGWKYNAWQRRVSRSRALNRLIFAGRRAGKTEFAAKDGVALAIAAAESPEWATGPTYPLADKVFAEAWKDCSRLHVLGNGSKYHGGLIALPNGSTIERRSADSPANVGAKNRLAILDEACRMDRLVWFRDVLPTLTDLNGGALIITSPNGYDWVNDIWLAWERGEAPDWECFEAPSWENEYVFPGGRQNPKILAAERTYEAAGLPELFMQEFGGKRLSLAGRVFKKWDASTMVVDDRIAYQGVREWFLGIDWGWRNPTCILLVGRVDAGWRVCAEWYETEQTEDQIAEAAVAMARKAVGINGAPLSQVWCDPEDPRLIDRLCRERLPATKAHNDANDKKLAVGEAIGRKGGLLVGRSCKHLIVCLDTLTHRPATAAGKSEIVSQVDDHAYDAFAYVPASIKESQKQLVRPGQLAWV
jgi:hypothetical protein